MRYAEILHKKGGCSARNPESFVLLYERNRWPLRVLTHRGWDQMKVIFRRPLTEDEVEYVEKSWRTVAFKYKDVNVLIGDEILFLGEDHEEIILLTEMFKNEIVKKNFKKKQLDLFIS